MGMIRRSILRTSFFSSLTSSSSLATTGAGGSSRMFVSTLALSTLISSPFSLPFCLSASNFPVSLAIVCTLGQGRWEGKGGCEARVCFIPVCAWADSVARKRAFPRGTVSAKRLSCFPSLFSFPHGAPAGCKKRDLVPIPRHLASAPVVGRRGGAGARLGQRRRSLGEDRFLLAQRATFSPTLTSANRFSALASRLRFLRRTMDWA